MTPRPAPSVQQVLLHNLRQVIGALHGCIGRDRGPGPCADCCKHAKTVAADAASRPRPKHVR